MGKVVGKVVGDPVKLNVGASLGYAVGAPLKVGTGVGAFGSFGSLLMSFFKDLSCARAASANSKAAAVARIIQFSEGRCPMCC